MKEVLKGQSHQILDYILGFEKLNQDLPFDCLWLLLLFDFIIPEIFNNYFLIAPKKTTDFTESR